MTYLSRMLVKKLFNSYFTTTAAELNSEGDFCDF